MLTATIRVPTEALSLEHTVREIPDAVIEVERTAATSPTRTMPSLWMTGADFTDVDVALAADPTVDSIVDSAQFDAEKYYEVQWDEPVHRRIDAYVDEAGVVLDATASQLGWHLTVRFARRDQFDDFREYVGDQDYSFDLLDLTELDAPRRAYGDLTPDQRDALLTALDHGYFEVPRETTTRELAGELDVSHQAVSEILRRGIGNLVEVLATDHSPVS